MRGDFTQIVEFPWTLDSLHLSSSFSWDLEVYEGEGKLEWMENINGGFSGCRSCSSTDVFLS